MSKKLRMTQPAAVPCSSNVAHGWGRGSVAGGLEDNKLKTIRLVE
jgi:hypothetical protein